MPQIIAIDPGETCGVSTLQYEPYIPLTFIHVPYKELMDWLLQQEVPYESVVVEDFRVRPSNKGAPRFTGSRMETIKAIGQVEMWAATRGYKVTLVPPANKEIGAKWTGIDGKKMPHSESHKFDAYNHGTHFLVSTGRVKLAEVLKGRKG